jgi:hypothetical protein
MAGSGLPNLPGVPAHLAYPVHPVKIFRIWQLQSTLAQSKMFRGFRNAHKIRQVLDYGGKRSATPFLGMANYDNSQ